MQSLDIKYPINYGLEANSLQVKSLARCYMLNTINKPIKIFDYKYSLAS